jgi:iron complex outermembrane receptor protein
MKVSRQIRICGSVRKLFLITLVASTALPLQAWAQQAVIEEIVVTAQKRTEKLQDVGISMSAFSSEDVKAFGFDDGLQVSEQVPNFNFDAAFGPSGPPQLSIRGISILDFSDSNESSVAMYFDEIYKGTVAGQNAQLFDIERIEVLRGPQGTLYGRNTPGGVVHFISKQPTEDFEAGASFQYGSFDQKIIEGFISGPLSDNFRARVAFKYNEDDGYQDNVFTGTDFAQTDIMAVRGIVEWDISDALTMTGKVYYSDSDSEYPGHGFFGTLDPVTGAPCSLARIEASECATRILS